MSGSDRALPERLVHLAGPLGEPGVVPAAEASPYETATPARSGYVERDGVPDHP